MKSNDSENNMQLMIWIWQRTKHEIGYNAPNELCMFHIGYSIMMKINNCFFLYVERPYRIKNWNSPFHLMLWSVMLHKNKVHIESAFPHRDYDAHEPTSNHIRFGFHPFFLLALIECHRFSHFSFSTITKKLLDLNNCISQC